MSQSRPIVLETSSSKNQPTKCDKTNPLPALKKAHKRGISALLNDCTNTVDTCGSKQVSKQRASEKISVQTAMMNLAPRGDNFKVGATTAVNETVETAATTTDGNPEKVSLCTIVRQYPSLYHQGEECISNYIARNASPEMQRAFALQVFNTAMTKWGRGIVESAKTAAEVTGFCAESIRHWACTFFCFIATTDESLENITDEVVEAELSSDRGRAPSNPSSIIHDEEFQLKAREFVRMHAHRKGEPNLTSVMFRQWISETFSVTICDETARLWMHKLGFWQHTHTKGIYFDGHERADVVAHREKFITEMAEIDKKSITVDQPSPDISDRPIIRVYHDESTFYANTDQSRFWADSTMQVLRQKSLGAAIMVSDFIDEVGGYLKDEEGAARTCIEPSKDGYWNSDGFLQQVNKSLDIFEHKYPDAQGLFLFDNAPSHRKCAPDSLNAAHMNVGRGGKTAQTA